MFASACTSERHDEPLTIAVASNFASPLQALQSEFEAASGHQVRIVAASTGQLYAQIVNGAPFDVLLAADEERPRALGEEGWGEPSSRYTYAVGRLALWTRDPKYMDALTLDVLSRGDYRWLAIANPDVAPYGVAAQQLLAALGLWETLQTRLVRGQNIAQTFLMAATGNAQLGLVALSQALAYEEHAAAYVVVPRELHEPIRQDAILLKSARDNPAALAFMQFLKSPAAQALIEQYGYLSD
jgi:molybdate transport system substrate-binding protein